MTTEELQADNAVLHARLAARTELLVAPCLCFLITPDRCTNCTDRELLAAPHPGTALLEQLDTLKAGQRSAAEARQQAFVELAEDLAAETPEERERHIRRIIDNAQENRP